VGCFMAFTVFDFYKASCDTYRIVNHDSEMNVPSLFQKKKKISGLCELRDSY
ncbi:1517_t:CDS:1, partial [Dentiscutata erythropus]